MPVKNRASEAPEFDSEFDSAGGLEDQGDLPEEPDWPWEDAMTWQPAPWWWRITRLRSRAVTRILDEEDGATLRLLLRFREQIRFRQIPFRQRMWRARIRLAGLLGGPRLDPEPAAFSSERLTDQARRALVLAQDEARRLGHSYIGTEHMLLGLIHEGECIGAKTLKSLGISLDAVRQQVEEIIGQGEGEPAPSGHIPWIPRARKVLQLSLPEAQQLEKNYIGSEHILLGLIAEGEGVAAQVLVRLGADLGRARQAVHDLG
jgi:Clp amino terminal domain, pathogenicity island component